MSLCYKIILKFLITIIGTKSEVIWFKSNLIIVSPPAQSTRYTSTTHTGSSNQKNTSPFELTKVTIFDTANKFIAYVGTFSHGIRTICCEWGGIYILGMDGKVLPSINIFIAKSFVKKINDIFILITDSYIVLKKRTHRPNLKYYLRKIYICLQSILRIARNMMMQAFRKFLRNMAIIYIGILFKSLYN